MTAVTQGATLSPSSSPRDRVRDFAEGHRSTSVIVSMLIITLLMIVLPKVPPFSGILSEQAWYSSFANAGVFVLLAMGLNIVIGMAGLLDLGYAAFYAIGAYVYAYSNSPYSGVDLPFLPMLLVGAAVAAVFGIALELRRCDCVATTSRS